MFLINIVVLWKELKIKRNNLECMDLNFEFINTIEKLIKICKELEKENILGVDIECENNLHYYGMQVALIQISSKYKNYIIDTVALKDISPLIKIFEDKKITKIFHDVSFDFRMLKSDYNCDLKNVYDTQLAAAFLNREQLGLGNLMEEFFEIKKECKFQMADWIKRPISEDMLSYAIHDTLHLIELKNILDEKLKKEGKLEWVNEEMKNLENKDWSYNQGTFFDMRGIKSISDKERAVAKELYDLRDKLAKKVNRPIHFLFGNKLLMEVSQKPMKNLKLWQNLKGVHPVVKQRSKEFLAATFKGLKKELPIESVPKKKWNQKQISKFTQLNEIKEKLSQKYNLPKYLILNKEDEKEIVLTGNLNHLSSWRRELIQKELI